MIDRDDKPGYSPSEGFGFLIDMAREKHELKKLLLTDPKKLLREGYDGMFFTRDMYELEIQAIRNHHCRNLDELARDVFTYVLNHQGTPPIES